MGSSIFIESTKFVKLAISQPCTSCGRVSTHLDKSKIRIAKSSLCFVVSKLCNFCGSGRDKITNYEQDYTSKVRFNGCQHAAVLGSGTTFTQSQKYLAMLGVTNFMENSTFYHQSKQQKLDIKIEKVCSEVVEQALRDTISEHKRREISAILTSFDNSWTHMRNAG